SSASSRPRMPPSRSRTSGSAAALPSLRQEFAQLLPATVEVRGGTLPGLDRIVAERAEEGRGILPSQQDRPQQVEFSDHWKTIKRGRAEGYNRAPRFH